MTYTCASAATKDTYSSCRPCGDTSVLSLQAKICKMLQPHMTDGDSGSSLFMTGGDVGLLATGNPVKNCMTTG